MSGRRRTQAEAPRPRHFYMTEEQALEALALRYRAPEWAFLPHLPSGTGSLKRRELDAVAMNLWPSRGNELLGFEVKCSRSDWIRELADPEKGEEGLGLCDKIYLVAQEADVELSEIPESWGWIEVAAGEAGKPLILYERKAPEPKSVRLRVFPRNLVAAILRAATRVAPEAQIEKAKAEGKKAGLEEGREQGRSNAAYLEKELEALRGVVRDFENAAGVRLAGAWIQEGRAQAVGAVVRSVLDGGHDGAIRSLENMRRELERLAAQIGKTIDTQKGAQT